MKQQLPSIHPDQRARLRAVPFSLSERWTKKGMTEQDFITAPHLPKWGNIVIVDRARQTLLEAPKLRERGGRNIGEKSDKGDAWRCMFLPRKG